MEKQHSSIFSFKQFCLKTLAPWLLYVAVGLSLLGFLFEKYIVFGSSASGVSKIYRINHVTDPEETPIFGSSRADNSFFPDTIGTHVFDYGIPGTKYNVILYFLQKECLKKKRNPYIIVNLDYEGFTSGLGDVKNYIPFTEQSEIREMIGAEYKPYFALPFLKYYGSFEYYVRDYLSEEFQATKVVNNGARLPKIAMAPQVFAKMVATRKKRSFNFSVDSQIAAKVLNVIKVHPERHFVFIVSPYHSSCFEQTPNLSKLDGLLSRLLQNPNVTYWDFSRLPLADDKFLNTTHLNVNGAREFSRVVRDSLLALRTRQGR
jgi:hypothetical protein